MSAADVLLDPKWFVERDPHAAFHAMRRECPIQRSMRADGHPFWVLVRHADAARVVKDPETFTSRHGVNLNEVRSDGPDPAADLLLEMSGPESHARLRPPLAGAHTRSVMSRLRPQLLRQAAGLIDAAVHRGRFDAAVDVSAPLAAFTSFELLGVPEDGWSVLIAGSRRAESMDPSRPVRPPFTTLAEEANHDLLRYFMRLVNTRRDDLKEGSIRTFIDVGADGRPWEPREVVLNALGLMDAGYGTLRHATTGGMLALLQHPDQHERVRAEPDLLPSLCDEVVRWVSPVMQLARVATRPVRLRGADVAAGDIVTVWLISANRDEEVFEEPGRFDAGRRPNRHLGYSVGPHSCLAGGLARMHLETVLGEFVRRVPPGARVGPAVRVVSNVISGIDGLPVITRSGP